MEVKKAIKRVFAIAAGATMLGATMLSALAAADLTNYPVPFVKDGKFDAFIVVGDKAAAEDVVGAVDIGASLQFEMKKDTMVSAGTDSVLVSDGIKIKGTGSEVLNYGEFLGEVRTTAFDAEDLPVLLADGRYVESTGATDNDETYTQTILLKDVPGAALNGLAEFDQPSELKADNYIYLNDGDILYRYDLLFDNFAEYDVTDAKDDIEGTQIEMQGNLYTITDIKLDGTNFLDDMTLMAGDTLLWLMQDQIVEKTVNGVKHEIKVVDVTDAEDSCGVSVDGYTAWIDIKSDKVINGVDIGVLDAKAVHAQLQDVDICELNIGATEIKINNAATGNGDLEVDGQEISDAAVDLMSTATAGEWTGIRIDFTPDDDVYLTNGTEFRDPALSNFKLLFGGVSAKYEAINLDRTSSRKAALEFTNNDGKSVELAMQLDVTGNDVLQWGSSDEKPILFEGSDYDCDMSIGASNNAEDCKKVQLYAITSGCTAHVIEITNVDAGALGVADEILVDLKDVTYGRTWNDKLAMSVGGVAQVIDLGSLGQITLDFGGNPDGDGTINVVAAGTLEDTACTPPASAIAGSSETEQGAWIKPHAVASNSGNQDDVSLPVIGPDFGNVGVCDYGAGAGQDDVCWVFNLDEDLDVYDDTSISTSGSGTVAPQRILGDVVYDFNGGSGDERLEFQTPSTNGIGGTTEWHAGGVSEEEGSDVEWYVTYAGTKVKFNGDTKAYIDISYPDRQVEFNAFLAPVAAQISTTGGNIATVTLDKINVGAARLASEVSDVTKDNLILVGGACANAATATVEGVSANEPDCYAGLKSGEAVIKLYEQTTGKVAMVVAGMDAVDTRRATRVVSNFDAYKLSGKEVKVTGTSLTDIKVSLPS